MTNRNLTDAVCHFGGVEATARWQGHAKQLEKPSSPRLRNHRSKVDRITGKTGKSIEGERVAEGSV
jgi:hypothetical protein